MGGAVGPKLGCDKAGSDLTRIRSVALQRVEVGDEVGRLRGGEGDGRHPVEAVRGDLGEAALERDRVVAARELVEGRAVRRAAVVQPDGVAAGAAADREGVAALL